MDRLRVAILVAGLAAVLLPLPAATEEGVRLRLEAPPDAVPPGERAELGIMLVDAAGHPRPTERDVEIVLETGEGLLETQTVTIPAGESSVRAPVRPERPGAWWVEAKGRGLFAANALVVCSDPEAESSEAAAAAGPQPLVRLTSRPLSPEELRDAEIPEGLARRIEAARPRLQLQRPPGALQPAPVPQPPPAAQPEPPPPPPPAVGSVVSMEPQSHVVVSAPELAVPDGVTGAPEADEEAEPDDGSATLAASGVMVLKPGETEVARGPDGVFRSQVHAVWFEGGAPAKSAKELRMIFLAEPQDPGHRLEPEELVLPAGASWSSAEIESEKAGEVELTALYPGAVSHPAKIRFLPSRPAALGFVRDGFEMKSLAGADLDVVVRLLDADGALVVADGPQQVSLSLETPGGVESHDLEIPAGGFEARQRLHVDRFGANAIEAAAPGLETARATVVLRLEWVLLLVALVGGVVGSLTRALFARGEKGWKKGLWRSIALGAVAAILVLLLALFRVLAKLGEALPALTGLDEVPLSNPLGIFLIGLVAGLALESIFAWFTGRKGAGGGPDALAAA